MNTRKEEMYSLIEDYQNSGLSQKEFSKTQQIRYATFNYWVCKYRKEKAQPDTASFIPLIPSKKSVWPISITFPNNIRIELSGDVPSSYIKQLIELY